jgi:hypothetical protein
MSVRARTRSRQELRLDDGPHRRSSAPAPPRSKEAGAALEDDDDLAALHLLAAALIDQVVMAGPPVNTRSTKLAEALELLETAGDRLNPDNDSYGTINRLRDHLRDTGDQQAVERVGKMLRVLPATREHKD